MFVSLGNSNQKGAIAELKVATAATCLGVPVLRPMTEHGRYDLAFEVGDRLLRVHCKWAAVRGEVVVVRLHSTYFTRTREVRVAYGADEIDAVAAYCARLERCYLLPIELVQDMRTINLRLNPPRNGQRAALHWAADYELPGAIAQLGERSAGSRKVVGSSPTSSIQGDRRETVVGAHEVRNRFGWYLERAAAGEDIRVTRKRSSVRPADGGRSASTDAPSAVSPPIVALRHSPGDGERVRPRREAPYSGARGDSAVALTAAATQMLPRSGPPAKAGYAACSQGLGQAGPEGAHSPRRLPD